MVKKKRFFPDIHAQLTASQKQKLFVDVDLPSPSVATTKTSESLSRPSKASLASFIEQIRNRGVDASEEEIMTWYYEFKTCENPVERAIAAWGHLASKTPTEPTPKRSKVSMRNFMPLHCENIEDSVYSTGQDGIKLAATSQDTPQGVEFSPADDLTVIDDGDEDVSDNFSFESSLLATSGYSSAPPALVPPAPPLVNVASVDKEADTEDQSIMGLQLDGVMARTGPYSQWLKQDEKTRQWRRYIGSLDMEVTATRPTIKPIPYATSILIKRLTPRPLSTSTRAKEVAVIRVYTASPEREIGRIPEDLTRILAPLIDCEMVEFAAKVLMGSDSRLRIGDSLYISVDIFLTNHAFESFETNDNVPGTSFSFVQESGQEARLRLRQKALSLLFTRLGISPLGAGESTHDETEIIDLEEPDADPTELSLDQLQAMYQDNNDSKLLTSLPEQTTPPISNFKLSLRLYQQHGLAWMLCREREFEVLDELSSKQSTQNKRQVRDSMGAVFNPLWKRYRWPQSSKQSSDHCSSDDYFYANMYSGEMSINEPLISSTTRGGILADEMGLGKTISTLALVNSVPYDTSTPSTLTSKKRYAARTTLVVVPMSLLSQWKSEFDKANANSNHICKIYYGDSTMIDLGPSLIRTSPIPVMLLTTYGTIVAEYVRLHKQRDMKGNLPATGLYSVEFFRVILDEGHNIRNRSTKTAKAVYELAAQRKWVLTGTPIINRLDDLYSVIKFLQLHPWSNFSYWKNFITLPFEDKQISQTLAVVKSILEPIFLRRTKNMKQTDGTPLVELPPKDVVIESVQFSPREKVFYDWFKAKAKDKFREGVNSGYLLKQYSQILTHILRLRQICCHIDLVQSAAISDLEGTASLDDNTNKEIKDLLAATSTLGFATASEANLIMFSLYPKIDIDTAECSICTSQPIPTGDMVVTPCGHTFCLGCILDHLNFVGTDCSCPNCRLPLSRYRLFKVNSRITSGKQVRFMTTNDQNDPCENYPFQLTLYHPDRSSSKIQALVSHLRVIKEQSPGEKVIVFSQFSSYLDIIDSELKVHGDKDLKVFKFDGRLQLADREAVLNKFNAPSTQGVIVLLLSLKAGGVGLNLTSASKAFMMDPWWSPSIEDQAIDRIHRIGQNETVKVVRFIMENSIEQKMLKIQERKKHLGEAVGAEEEQKQRRIEEIQIMFED
ncbi:DNA repair protein Rad5p [Diutina catenulata]